jgi:hypothetical protein
MTLAWIIGTEAPSPSCENCNCKHVLEENRDKSWLFHEATINAINIEYRV